MEFHYLYGVMEWMKNSVDPDQLAANEELFETCLGCFFMNLIWADAISLQFDTVELSWVFPHFNSLYPR